MFSPASRGRLTSRDVDRFPDDTLFDRLARTVCQAGCLPRKELYEAWEMARRVRRLFRGGRVLDVGGGHGLLAQVMLLLDDSSPNALVIDKTLPASSAKLHDVLVLRVAEAVGTRRVCRQRDRRRRHSRHRHRRVESRVRRAYRSGSGARRRRACASRRHAVLPRSRFRRCGGSVRLGGWRARYRHRACDAAGAARLSHLDASDSRRHHAEEPAAVGRSLLSGRS